MTHPKARSKPRPRAARRPTDRIVITTKGRAMAAAYDAMLDAARRNERANDKRAAPEAPASLPEPGESPGARSNPQHEQACLTPCAPERDAPAAPGQTPAAPCHVGCTPAHPAGKSEAAPLVNQPETDQ